MESEMSEVLNWNKENAQNIERIQGSIHTMEADRNKGIFSERQKAFRTWMIKVLF